jgi:hypothetical protein
MLSRDKLIIDRPLGLPPFFKKRKKERLEGLAFQQKIYIFIKEEQKNTVRSSRNEKKKKIKDKIQATTDFESIGWKYLKFWILFPLSAT